MCAGTVAEGAPIIPISAQLKYNIEVVCEYITKKVPIPKRDFLSPPRLIGKLVNINVSITIFLRKEQKSGLGSSLIVGLVIHP